MSRLTIPLFLLLTGCASLDDVVGGIANTPEWFQERRVEIRGEGYPDFAEVPEINNTNAISQRLAQTKALAQDELEAFESHPRYAPANITEEDMHNLAESMRADLPATLDDIDPIMDDADIRELRRQLRPPPIGKSK